MVPVILDTDIGTDIDDTWALTMLLGCPELDQRLVVTANGDTTYRARIAAEILAAAGRSDIPLAIGPASFRPSSNVTARESAPQRRFADQVDLAHHPGGVAADRIGALVDCVMTSPDPVTIVPLRAGGSVGSDDHVPRHLRFDHPVRGAICSGARRLA